MAQLPNPEPDRITIPVPVLRELFKFLLALGLPPILAFPIAIDVAVLVLGFFILLIFPSEQKLSGLIVLVFVIIIGHVFGTIIVVMNQKKRGRR